MEATPAEHTSDVAMDLALPSDTVDEHLSFPILSEPVAPVASSSTSAQTRPLLKDRLYVGNLHPSVDEYTLLQVFSKFGKIAKLVYLFHKSGPLKGKPRGYAFVEYSNDHDAEKALTHAHDKLLRGRKLVVTYANQAPVDPVMGGTGVKNRRGISEVGKPTTLSLLKSAGTVRSDATDAKIARMEAKLRQMEGTSGTTAGGSLLGHPSLPPKPVAAAAAAAAATSPRHTPTNAASGSASGARKNSRAPPLPSLPLRPPSQPVNKSDVAPSAPPVRSALKKPTLAGVRIVKSKNTGPSG